MKMTLIELEYWESDPERPGYQRFAGTPTYREVFRRLSDALHAEGLIDEYLSPGLELEMGTVQDNAADGSRTCRLDTQIPRGVRWVAAWACTGGSEGHYVHVELMYSGGTVFDETTGMTPLPSGRVPLALAKTFAEWEHAWLIAKRAAALLGA